MKFDFNLGIEAVFDEWVDDGCQRAMAILNAAENAEEVECSTCTADETVNA